MNLGPHLVSAKISESAKVHDLEQFVMTTKAESVLELLRRWSHSNSLSILPITTGCCSMEYMSAMGIEQNVERIGLELERFSPKHADLMVVAGTITEKLAPVIKQVYHEMPLPKWVIAMGSCACSGGMFRTYPVVQGLSRDIPVDIYIPGCPPTAEAFVGGLKLLKKKIKQGGRSLPWK